MSRLNVLVLMAGPTDAFRDAGFPYPKNLVELDGAPLVQRVLEGLDVLSQKDVRLICCVRADEDTLHHTGAVVRLLHPNAAVLNVPSQTGGAAATALLAIGEIDNDAPLLIVNGDQILKNGVARHIADFTKRKLDGGIVVFESVHPRWSYVLLNDEGRAVETAEKRPISNLATAGAYYFKTGRQFVASTQAMIRKDARVNGVFYVCPAYNELILSGGNVGVSKIAKGDYVSLATPADVETYQNLLARRG